MSDLSDRPRRRDALPGLLTGALVLAGTAVALVRYPGDPGVWAVSAFFLVFGATVAALGWSLYPRALSAELVAVVQHDGPVLVVPTRRPWAATFAVIGFAATSVAMATASLVALVQEGPTWGLPGRGAVVLAGALLMLWLLPSAFRSLRSTGSLGWVLERRGVALPVGAARHSIPWTEITGMDVRDVTIRGGGSRRTLRWIVLRTASPTRFVAGRPLRWVRRIDPDATVVLSTRVLRCTPEVALERLRTLWEDEEQRRGLGTSTSLQEQDCAPFPEHR